MTLGDLDAAAFQEFAEYQIEDVRFFWDMVARFIEDMDLVAYSVMRERGKEEITEALMADAVRLVSGRAASVAPEREAAFLSPRMVRDFSRAPVPHQEGAIEVLAVFLTNETARVMLGAAQLANKEDLEVVKLRHILPGCERWPWPLNRYC